MKINTVTKNSLYMHVFGNKYIDVDWHCGEWNVIGLGVDLNIRRKTDHGGLEFRFHILNFWFDFSFYDNRHWDDHNNCYHTPNKSNNGDFRHRL